MRELKVKTDRKAEKRGLWNYLCCCCNIPPNPPLFPLQQPYEIGRQNIMTVVLRKKVKNKAIICHKPHVTSAWLLLSVILRIEP